MEDAATNNDDLQKLNRHYIRGMTRKRATSDGIHPRGFASA